jgi:glyoxylase-like metal-dependent hydrolase (beta-lactamase superfamily II)/8-oxo-dGTP pyrophosphatase MutT (NUDIX family)
MMIHPLSAEQLAQAAQGARQAASVILLRDGPAGPEVLLLRRAEREGDPRSGIWVFPGGALDAADAQLHSRCPSVSDAYFSARLGLAVGGLDYAVAAIRECFEEAGLLLAQGDIGAVLEHRAVSTSGEAFVRLVQRHDLLLAVDQLNYHSHWLTPPGASKRFDTRFFITRAPLHQIAQADQGETTELAWMTPTSALNPAARLKLLPVTRRILQDLARFASAQACLDEAAQRRDLACQMPRLGRDARGVRPVLPEEAAWAEIGRLDPQGRGDVPADLQPLRSVALSQRVQRITCANGSMMTGPGTNTYVIGSPGAEAVAVLDPGPLDPHTEAHLQAVLAAVAAMGAQRVSHILLTHSHRDHSPAAQRLRELTGAQLLGHRAHHLSGQDLSFRPEHEPADGEHLVLGPDCTLHAVFTPGHASNHICWLLEQERLLFTGDHVMQASTVVINPPDGQMATYMASLERLLTLDLEWLAPGHGFLMAHPHTEVQRLLAHRRQREAKVFAALRAAGVVRAEELVSAVYGDVPVARHGIAARSLQAHLIKLEAENRVELLGERWRVRGKPASPMV